MQILYLCLLIAFWSITSAWPHPDEFLGTLPDLGSIFDIFSLPTSDELDAFQAGPDECRVEDNVVEPPESGGTIEGGLFGSTDNTPLDLDLFNNLLITQETRKAPPCGPDGTHYRLCCRELWGAPGILSSCQSGTYDLIYFSKEKCRTKRETNMMNLNLQCFMRANRYLEDLDVACADGGRFCCQDYEVSSRFYFSSASM